MTLSPQPDAAPVSAGTKYGTLAEMDTALAGSAVDSRFVINPGLGEKLRFKRGAAAWEYDGQTGIPTYQMDASDPDWPMSKADQDLIAARLASGQIYKFYTQDPNVPTTQATSEIEGGVLAIVSNVVVTPKVHADAEAVFFGPGQYLGLDPLVDKLAANVTYATTTDAQFPLYDTQYALSALSDMMTVTHDRRYLDAAKTHITGMIGAANVTLDVDMPGADPRVLKGRPEVANGATAGVTYQAWTGAGNQTGNLEQQQFTIGCMRVLFDIATGAYPVTDADLAFLDTTFDWFLHNQIEKWTYSRGFFHYRAPEGVEYAVSNTDGGTNYLGFWIDQMIMWMGNLAYADALCDLLGKTKPPHLAGATPLHDFRKWVSDYVGDYAPGDTTDILNLAKVNSSEINPTTGIVEVDFNNPEAPVADGGANGTDTGHAQRIPALFLIMRRTGVLKDNPSTLDLVNRRMQAYNNNARAVIGDDGSVAWYANGVDDVGQAGAHVFPTMASYAVDDPLIRKNIETLYDKAIAGDTSHPSYARHNSWWGRACLIASMTLADNKTRSELGFA